MNPNREQIEALFEAARQLAPRAEQAAYLARACGDDLELRRQVEAMLEAAAAADQYFRTAQAPGEAVRDVALKKTPTASTEPLTEGPGTIIGRYKLLQQIGEGGFGVVYMAEQREPVVRKVALKVIKLGMDTKQVVTRFEVERQALALMDHPHIAKVLDAGATETGRPYFVMELVHGVPITTYCDRNNLSPEERLKLILPVCQAIQHAHQKGIIHRDIKPSNVLVTLNDGVRHPMVIDFGVAKALNQRLTEKTLFTEFGQMIGTPAYMSPEQAEMSKLDVDTRSDVYALGVLLYELLTGTTPFPEQRLRSAGWAEMQRIITEEEPPRPSTRLCALTDAERTGIAQHRQTDARKLTFLVRGELDWMVMKALEKDRTRRYETANGLAMDIQRYLNDEPVLAVAPSARYRMMKFVRRHRAGLAVTAALFGVLVAGVIVSSWQMVRARKAEKEAVAARGQAEAVSEFLVETFRSPDPQRDGRKVTVAEVLDRATKDLVGRFEDAPERKAALLGALGETYLGLGLYQPAERLVSESRDLYQRVLGSEHLSTLDAMNRLGLIYEQQGRLAEAEQLNKKTLETSRRVFGPRHRLTTITMNNLGIVYHRLGKHPEAEQIHREMLEVNRLVFGTNSGEVWTSLHNLAAVYLAQDRLEEAEKILFDLAQRSRQKGTFGKHLGGLSASYNLASVYARQRRTNEATELFEETLALERRSLGTASRSTRITMGHLGYWYTQVGKLDRAIPLKLEHLQLYAADPNVPDNYTDVLDAIAKVTSTPNRIKYLAQIANVCAEVFTNHPSVAGDLDRGLRALAARGAAAAAAPQTEPEASLDSAERTRLRALALGWLRADLTLWTERFDPAQTLQSLAIEDALSRWHESPYLASIRDPDALRALPESEQRQFASLWVEVGALRNKVLQLKHESWDTLLPKGSRWAYLADSSNPGTAWRQADFEAAAWKRGPGPLGYGDAEMTTEIGLYAGPKKKYITTFFRTSFTVGRLEPYDRLVLRLRRDDGAAVYLNGREILRDNLPRKDTLAFDTLAPRGTEGAAETDYHLHESEIAALRTGTNAVAVEVHQRSPQNSDLVFDLEILALRRK